MLWKCDACKTLYAVDMPVCPQCGDAGHTEVDSGGEPVGPRFETAKPTQPVADAVPADGSPVKAKASPKAPAGA